MISLHSHSGQFCRHAKGTLEEVVQEAIRKGFKVYGLSEHVPRYRLEDLYPEEANLTLEELESTFDAYIKEASRLRTAYADQIELLIGLETECITQDSLTHLQTLLKKHEVHISYMVGSVHHVSGIPIDFDEATFHRALSSFEEGHEGLSQMDQLFCSYFDAQYQLLRLCQPEVVGHFDLCRLYVPEASLSAPAVWSKVERNVRYAVSYGALFEVNAAAFRKGWSTAYPGKDVVDVRSAPTVASLVLDAVVPSQLVLSENGRFTLSDDSHGPHAVALHYKDAHRYLMEAGVKDLYYLTLDQDHVREHADCQDTARRQRQAARMNTRVVRLGQAWQEHAFWQLP